MLKVDNSLHLKYVLRCGVFHTMKLRNRFEFRNIRKRSRDTKRLVSRGNIARNINISVQNKYRNKTQVLCFNDVLMLVKDGECFKF